MHRLGGRQDGRTLQMSRTGSSNYSSGLSKDPPLHYSPGISWFKGRLNDTYFEIFYPVSGVKLVDNIRFSIPAKKGGKVLQVNKAVVC